jgi:type VI secretion system protein ImpH
MATARGRQSAAVAPPAAAALGERPQAVAFFQAVRLLGQLFPERAEVGGFADPHDEVVRFGVNPAIGFPPSEIHRLDLSTEPARMLVNFFGLVGPLGVLPYHYSLLVGERARAGDSTLGAFLDLFHHRLIALFYRAWRKHHYPVGFGSDAGDHLTGHLLDGIGLGVPALRDRLPIPDQTLAFYGGLLAAHQRSALALEQLLEDYFDVPVEVIQFVGAWYAVPPRSQCELDDGAGETNRLGAGVVGDELWDRQARVRIRIGPLPRDRYDGFLPGGPAHAALRALTQFFSDDRFDFEVQLVLARDHVPPCVLHTGAHGVGPPLGWATWLASKPAGHEVDDTVLTL